MEEQFLRLCKIGNLDDIKKLIETQYVNIYANDEDGFRWACDNGHLHIVKYLINLYKLNEDYKIINIHSHDE